MAPYGRNPHIYLPTPGALLSLQGPHSRDETVNIQPFNAFTSCVGTQENGIRALVSQNYSLLYFSLAYKHVKKQQQL